MADDKLFPPPEDFAKKALVNAKQYEEMYARSIKDPEGFWREQAKRIHWIKPPTKIKDVSYDPANLHIRWYDDATLNVSANCLDRHLSARGNQTAILWEGDDPKESKAITYSELHQLVCKFANVLKAQG